MKKTNSNSTLEIWGGRYINYPKTRKPEDIDKIILQVEPTMHDDTYIVEVIDNDK